MRKGLLLFLLLSSVCGFSQSVRFGLTASPQLTWLTAQNTDFGSGNFRLTNEGSKLGFVYGILIDFMIDQNEHYTFSTGMLVSHTGGKLKAEMKDSNGTIAQTIRTNYKLQYLEFPLSLRLRTSQVGYITYYGQFGVTGGINIRARGEKTLDPDPIGLSGTNVKLDDVSGFKVALALGAGIEYSLTGNTALILGIFFNNGFNNIITDEDGEKTTLNELGLRLGIMF